jgi:uncharacterized protein
MSVSAAVLNPYEAVAGAQVVANSRLWLERAVIGLQLCPFAKAVYTKKQIRYAVTAAEDADALLLVLNSELELLARTPAEEIETTLLIHPLVMNRFIDFHFFLGEADAAIRNLSLEGVVQIAGFHPQFEFAGSTAEAIDNYTNRSPDPTLHLLREASIERAVAAFPDATSIFEANVVTMRRLGHEGWRKLWVT